MFSVCGAAETHLLVSFRTPVFAGTLLESCVTPTTPWAPIAGDQGRMLATELPRINRLITTDRPVSEATVAGMDRGLSASGELSSRACALEMISSWQRGLSACRDPRCDPALVSGHPTCQRGEVVHLICSLVSVPASLPLDLMPTPMQPFRCVGFTLAL